MFRFTMYELMLRSGHPIAEDGVRRLTPDEVARFA